MDWVSFGLVERVFVLFLSSSIPSITHQLFGDRFGDSSVPIGVVVDDTGTLAFVAHANADVITEIHLETGELLRTLVAGKEPDGMGFSPLSVVR